MVLLLLLLLLGVVDEEEMAEEEVDEEVRKIVWSACWIHTLSVGHIMLVTRILYCSVCILELSSLYAFRWIGSNVATTGY